MMPQRTFTVRYEDKTQVYEGFSNLKSAPEFLALVFFEGESELWALDWYVDTNTSFGQPLHIPSARGISELQRFYQEQYDFKAKVWVYANNTSYSKD